MVEKASRAALPGDQASSFSADHPSSWELVAYRSGNSSECEREEIRDHLAVCRECTRIMLDMAGEHQSVDLEVDGAWKKLADRMGDA